MTDEKLVAELRHPRQRNERYYEPLCARAADELERLAALAQTRQEREMTDEERKDLLAEMRYYMDHGQLPDLIAVCNKAANELERLTRENHILKLGAETWPEILKDRDERLAAIAQSDAEPVTEIYDKIKGHAVTQSHRPDVSAGLYEIAIAQAIEGPHNLVSSNEPLEESRVQKWVIITERKRKKRLRQARAVIDLIKSSPDASAGMIEAAKMAEEEAQNWSTEGRYVLLNYAKALRARATDRSGK